MCWPSPICDILQHQNPAQNLLTKIDNSIIDSCTQGLTSLGTVWLKVKTPDLTGGRAATVSGHAPNAGNIETVLGYVTWIGLALAIVSLIALGALIAVRLRSGEGIAAIGRIGAVLGGVIILSGATSIVTSALPDGPHGVGGATGFIQSSLWWYMIVAAIASVIIGAIRMIWEQRAQPGRDTVKSLLTLIVVAGAGVTIVNMLITAADSFSMWVIDKAMACSPADQGCFVASVKHILKLAERSSAGNGILLMMIIALLELLTIVIQIVLMVARSGMLVLLAGVLPLAASATNTEMGKMWFKRCVSWLAAFLLYKPVASLVYAAAFQLITRDEATQDALLNVLTGAMLLILAVLALPALLRFVAPMASAASGGHASGAAAMMAAGRLPSGARTTASNQSTRTTSTTSTSSTQAPSGSAGSSGGSGGSRTVSNAGIQQGATGGASESANAQAMRNQATRTAQPDGNPGSENQPASDAGGAATTVTTTEASRGRRYTEGAGHTGRMLQGAAAAAGAVHAITEEATGSGH